MILLKEAVANRRVELEEAEIARLSALRAEAEAKERRIKEVNKDWPSYGFSLLEDILTFSHNWRTADANYEMDLYTFSYREEHWPKGHHIKLSGRVCVRFDNQADHYVYELLETNPTWLAYDGPHSCPWQVTKFVDAYIWLIDRMPKTQETQP